MAGTFPDNSIFESMTIRSDTNQFTTIDGANNVYGKLPGEASSGVERKMPEITHAWEFDLTTKPMTRSEMGPILAFLNKQNGSAETFEITPPQTNSRNGDANTDRIFILQTALTKGAIGIVFNIAALEDSPSLIRFICGRPVVSQFLVIILLMHWVHKMVISFRQHSRHCLQVHGSNLTPVSKFL